MFLPLPSTVHCVTPHVVPVLRSFLVAISPVIAQHALHAPPQETQQAFPW